MNEDIEKTRKMVESNQIDSAFEKLTLLTKTDRELNDQVLVLVAKFRDVRKKENLGLIGSDEAFTIRSQVNYAMLNILTEYETKSSNFLSSSTQPPQHTVFISYNHNDIQIVNKLKEKLRANNIDVTIDSEKMLAGEDIADFIEKSVSDTETTISIISKKSLLSAWVAMETINTYYHQKTKSDKKFIACYIEDDFFQRNFTDDALDIVDAQLHEIDAIKKTRIEKGRNTRDLNNEYTRLKELSNGMDEIVRRLRESLCIDIRNENLEANFKRILQKIES